jgi:hypothetical protein
MMRSILAVSFLLGMAISTAQATVIAVGPGAFAAGSTLITFDGLATDDEVNGLSVGGVLFSYSLGSGALVIGGGPGVSNNISPPNVTTISDVFNPKNTGILTLTLGGRFDVFGYGYSILNQQPVVNATTIKLFTGAANVGTWSYNGVVDPTFTGGFAGIQSTIPFDRVEVIFNAAAAPLFALDNIQLATTTIPEPAAVILVLSGALALLWQRLSMDTKRSAGHD